MRCKIVRTQKLMWHNIMKLTKNQKNLILHYNIAHRVIKTHTDTLWWRRIDDYVLSETTVAWPHVPLYHCTHTVPGAWDCLTKLN